MWPCGVAMAPAAAMAMPAMIAGFCIGIIFHLYRSGKLSH
jgi:hypothetical protein